MCTVCDCPNWNAVEFPQHKNLGMRRQKATALSAKYRIVSYFIALYRIATKKQNQTGRVYR